MNTDDSFTNCLSRLSVTFRGPGGIVGERLSHILQREAQYEQVAAQQTDWFMTLMDSFQDFYIHTFDEAAGHKHVVNIDVCVILAASFYRMRCALIGFYRGYPFDAAASARPLFENASFLGAALHGIVSHDDMFSFADNIDFEVETRAGVANAQRDHLRDINNDIRNKMWGPRSGLDKREQEEIEALIRTFHSHVHRAESTVVELTGEMLKRRALPPLAPVFNLRRANVFATSLVYVSWLLLRVVPFRSYPGDFSEEWKLKYDLLDKSFDCYLHSTQSAVYPAFRRMVQMRFTFDPDDAWKRIKVEPIR